MGEIKVPGKAKLIVGLLSGDKEWFELAGQELEEILDNKVEMVSEIWPFENSRYYESELGLRVFRQFMAFSELFAMDQLADAKLATNKLERKLGSSLGGGRPVNIDPGYITLGSLVLATTKKQPHRIYLGKGIFAELTLGYESGGWRTWQWTYPDYASASYFGFFSHVRSRLKEQRLECSDR